jgi:capsular exopolysaccharide synthesis family protein
MRHPCVHKVFEIKDGSGLVNYLTNLQAWQTMVRPTGLPGLDVLVCGPKPPNPAELLSTERMLALIREATASYDLVVLDSPPLLGVTDSSILATTVEGVVLVIKGGATPREVVERAQTKVRGVGANLIGIVLNNNVNVCADDYYYRHRRYDHYGSRQEDSD